MCEGMTNERSDGGLQELRCCNQEQGLGRDPRPQGPRKSHRVVGLRSLAPVGTVRLEAPEGEAAGLQGCRKITQRPARLLTVVRG